MRLSMTSKPTAKPQNPCFSSGPCAKRPGWSVQALAGAFTGRSHRAAEGKKRLNDVVERQRKILGVPADYKMAIVPASDTGAIEMALWSMLGARGVDVLAWENFGEEWLKDITKQLKIADCRTFTAPYGELPNLSQVDCDRDVVFTWNGTTGGVRVPNGDWIKSDRQGLTFCDATSGVFAYDLPWDRLDVTTWSWQKVLGGEAAHGMIVLSPRAVERLTSFKPDRPLPKIFRMTGNGKLTEGIFQGETINTPSMLAVEDCLDALKWVESVGGLKGLEARVDANYKAVEAWVAKTPWIEFLPDVPAVRSKTSVCLKITDAGFLSLSDDGKQDFIKAMGKLLDKEQAAYDIAGHKAAPAGLRIWCGATVEASDVTALGPWLDWAFAEASAQQGKAAA
jgi:phosphoserine aminotransferase